MDGSIVFASLRQCASNEGTLAPAGEYDWTCAFFCPYPSPQLKRQMDWFIHFCTAHGRVSSGMLGHDLYPNNCPHRMGIWAPSKICLVGPTRVHNPNSISIGSAVFAVHASVVEHVGACRSPSKLPLPMVDLYPHLIRGSLGSPDSASQTAFRSVQPFL